MSDLHRALRERTEDFRPELTPPLAVLRARKRRRDQRRAGAAVALSAVAAFGVVAVPNLLQDNGGGQDRPGTVAGGGPAGPQDEAEYVYSVNWRTRAAYFDEVEQTLQGRCFTAPGVERGITYTSLPPGHGGRIVGTGNAETFLGCVADSAPGANVVVRVAPEQVEPDAVFTFRITYTDTEAFDATTANPAMQACLDLPGISDPLDPFFTRPPLYNVTAVGAAQAEALLACAIQFPGVSVLQTAPAPSDGSEPHDAGESVDERLLALADDAAARSDGEARRVEAVETTRRQAEALTDTSTNEPDVPVWVVQVSGDNYTCGLCSVPSGADAPTGRHLLIVVSDAYRPTSFGIRPSPANLASLGGVRVLRGG